MKKIILILILLFTVNINAQSVPKTPATTLILQQEPERMEQIVRFAEHKWGTDDKGVLEYEIAKQSYSYITLILMVQDKNINPNDYLVIVMELAKYLQDEDDSSIIDWQDVLRDVKYKLKN